MSVVTQGVTGVLRGLSHKPIVVVADRYPPEARGGAEVSLHIVLKSLPNRHDLLVVAFSDEHLLPHLYGLDGVRVLYLPRQAPWPLHRYPAPGVDRVQSLAPPLAARLRSERQRLAIAREPALSPGERDRFQKLMSLQVRGGVSNDFLEYPEGASTRALRTVLKWVRPELIHADNYRAIAIAGAASEGMPMKRIGVVRDNRFHCVRHDQSVRVAGRLCESCDFACAAVDCPEAPELLKAMLQRSHAYRLACLKRMDRVVVTSQYLEREVGRLIDPKRIMRIPNQPDPVDDVHAFTRGIAELPGTNLLVVGMLTENKGQIDLVKHLDRLVQRVPDVVVHFAGRGARIERRIQEVVAENGLEDRVVLHGHLDRPELYALYRQCQIVVLPTLWPEPFGRVPLEAAMAGRPVVAFAVGGLRESIVDGRTGLLAEPGDFERLIASIGELAGDPERRRAMAARAHSHISSMYGPAAISEKLAALWNSFLPGAIPATAVHG